MKFARFPLRDATGLILAHSIATKGGVIKKGRVLSQADVARLEGLGLGDVMAARPEPGDVGEDAAAARIAAPAAGEGTRAAAPFTGRANIYATAAGLAVVDRDAIARLNAIDEGLTVATVSPFEKVEPGQMLATVKVITFMLSEATVAKAEAVCREARSLVRVAAFRPRTAGLILTRMPSTKPSVLEKRRKAIESRLAAMGARVGPCEIVAHDETETQAAIQRMQALGADPIILFAASAIVDRGDVIPSALVGAGGRIIRLGMPVDPGNLMLLGALGQTPVIGAPSCAASPKINGFDWILERLLAGLDVQSADVAGMGVGGLLKEIAIRPQPRDGGEQPEEGAMDEADGKRQAARIGAVVLAAGRSTRFGPANKLLADLDGAPLVRRAVQALLDSRARPVVVVTGHMHEGVRAALDGLPVSIVHNPDFAQGLSTSLKVGLKALPDSVDGAIVALGDMPGIEGQHIDRLIVAFAPKEGRSIVVPVHGGKRGNPVLFARDILPEMAEVAGDTGARHIIGRHADDVVEVDLGTDAIFIDVDTPEALSRFKQGRTQT